MRGGDMNPLLQQLIGMAPGIGAAVGGDGNAFASFMECYQRTMQQLEQRKRLQQQDSLALQDRDLALQDRQAQMTRQQAQDARLAEDQSWQNEQRNLNTAQLFSTVGGNAESVPEMESAIDTITSVLTPERRMQMAPARDAALRGAGVKVSSRQKSELKRWVKDDLLESRFVKEHADSDPDVTQAMPARIRQLAESLTGKTEFRKSDLLSLTETMEQAKPSPPSAPFNLSPGQTRFGGDGTPIASLPPRPTGGGTPDTPDQIFVTRNGQVIPITKGTALPGDIPYSPRNQNETRPVTSGDATDIADINEALKLAAGLNFKPSDTGIMPALGAAAPDAVTNLTGFGVGAKQRQGVINLVKQIIGKGLEGGVLRKEDESKYAKMLPTIGDHPDVVQSKIATLISTLEQKRTVRLDAMRDAGYDISKFEARAGAAGTGANSQSGVPVAQIGERRKFGDELREWNGTRWVLVNPGQQ